MRIGELSRHSGCDVETIRYYEREGCSMPRSARTTAIAAMATRTWCSSTSCAIAGRWA